MSGITGKGRKLVVLSTFIMALMCGLTYWMYTKTGYAMYFYIYITSLFCTGTSLLLILLKIKRKRPMKWKFLQKMPLVLRVLYFMLYGLLIWYCGQASIGFLNRTNGAVYPKASNVVIFLVIFVVSFVLDKLCGHSKENGEFVDVMLENISTFMQLLSFETIIAAAVTVFESLQFFLIQNYVGYVFTAILLYYAVCILLSMIVIAIRKEFTTQPYLNIPLPSLRIFGKKKGQETRRTTGLIEYLETNTGLSMRSLWSVKFVREIAPYVVLLSGLFLWLSTCIVQVESYQQAAVYRFGVLQEVVLGPGLHLTFPYPFDQVETYDTEVVNKTTIGYRSEESTDNIWTTNHQGEEYKLLLGSGDEVVSINLRLEYKISDLVEYLRSSTKPESILEALSYELVTDQTIHTDLSTLLSTDREAFSEMFMKELKVMLEEKKVGLEVVSVVLESIHPPKEISSVYQQAVSAEIEAEATILEAEATAEVTLTNAQITYDTEVSTALAEQVEKVANAKSAVAEFMASLEAYNGDADAYTYQKYLNAVREAYGNANLVIISEDIDESALYFGNFSSKNGGSEDSNTEDNVSEE